MNAATKSLFFVSFSTDSSTQWVSNDRKSVRDGLGCSSRSLCKPFASAAAAKRAVARLAEIGITGEMSSLSGSGVWDGRL